MIFWLLLIINYRNSTLALTITSSLKRYIFFNSSNNAVVFKFSVPLDFTPRGDKFTLLSLLTAKFVSERIYTAIAVTDLFRNKSTLLSLLQLDLFTGGLSSFLWSEDVPGEEELEEPEDLIAGMELTVHGVAVRPFIFFNGHAELMGHIWAGTASERTNVLQVKKKNIALISLPSPSNFSVSRKLNYGYVFISS